MTYCCAVTDPTGMAVVGNDLRNVLRTGAYRVTQYELADQI